MSVDEIEAGGTCEPMLLRMSCALDGNLSDHEMAELSAHLAACAPCRARAIELGAADRLFRVLENKRLVPRSPGAAFAQQVMERVRLEAVPVGGILEFTRLVAQDPGLQNQFRPAANMELFVELFVSVGWQRGYRFGSGEVVSLLTARHAVNDDLSDEQLDAVVGGAGLIDAEIKAFIGDVSQHWFKPVI